MTAVTDALFKTFGAQGFATLLDIEEHPEVIAAKRSLGLRESIIDIIQRSSPSDFEVFFDESFVPCIKSTAKPEPALTHSASTVVSHMEVEASQPSESSASILSADLSLALSKFSNSLKTFSSTASRPFRDISDFMFLARKSGMPNELFESLFDQKIRTVVNAVLFPADIEGPYTKRRKIDHDKPTTQKATVPVASFTSLELAAHLRLGPEISLSTVQNFQAAALLGVVSKTEAEKAISVVKEAMEKSNK